MYKKNIRKQRGISYQVWHKLCLIVINTLYSCGIQCFKE